MKGIHSTRRKVFLRKAKEAHQSDIKLKQQQQQKQQQDEEQPVVDTPQKALDLSATTPPVTPESDSGGGDGDDDLRQQQQHQQEWNRQHYHTTSDSSPVGEVVTITSRSPTTVNGSSSTPTAAAAAAAGLRASFGRLALVGGNKAKKISDTSRNHNSNSHTGGADDGTLMSELTDNRTITRIEPTVSHNNKPPLHRPHAYPSLRDSNLGPIPEAAAAATATEDSAANRRNSQSSSSSSKNSKKSASGGNGNGSSGNGGGGVAVASYHRGKLQSLSEQEKQHQQQRLQQKREQEQKMNENNANDEEDISPAAFITNIFGIVDLACSSSRHRSAFGDDDDDDVEYEKKKRELRIAKATAAVRDFAPEWGVAPSMDQETDFAGTLQEKANATAAAAAAKKETQPTKTTKASLRTKRDADNDGPPLDHLMDHTDDDEDDSIFSGDNDPPASDQQQQGTNTTRTIARRDPQGEGPSACESSSSSKNSSGRPKMDAPAGACDDNTRTAITPAASPRTIISGVMSSSGITGGDLSQRATMLDASASTSSSAAAADNRSLVDHENFEMVLEDLALQEQLEHGDDGNDKQNQHNSSNKLSKSTTSGARWIGRALGLGKSKTPGTLANVSNNKTFSATQITTIGSNGNTSTSNNNNNKLRAATPPQDPPSASLSLGEEKQQDEPAAVLGINSQSMLDSWDKSRPVGPGELLWATMAPSPMPAAATNNNDANSSTPPAAVAAAAAAAAAGIPRMPSGQSNVASTDSNHRLYQGGWQNVVFPETAAKNNADIVRTTSPREQLEDELFAAIALSSATITSQDGSSSKQTTSVVTDKSPFISPTPTMTSSVTGPMPPTTTAAALDTKGEFTATAAANAVPQFEPSALATYSAATSPQSSSKAAIMTTNPRQSNSTLYYRPQKMAPFVEVTEEKKEEEYDDDDEEQAFYASKKASSSPTQLNAFKHLAFGRRVPRKTEDPTGAYSDTETTTRHLAFTRRGRPGTGGQSDTEMSTSRKTSRFRSLAVGAGYVPRTSANHDLHSHSDSEARKPMFQLRHLKKKVTRSRMLRRRGKGNEKSNATSYWNSNSSNNRHHQQSMAGGSSEELKARGPGVYLRDLDLIGDEVVEDLYANLDRQIEQEGGEDHSSRAEHYGDGRRGGGYLGSMSMEDQETTDSEQDQSYLGSIPGASHMTDLSQLTMDTPGRGGGGDDFAGRRGHDHYAMEKSLILPVKQSSSGSAHDGSVQSHKEKATGGKPNVLSGLMSYIAGNVKRSAPNTYSVNGQVVEASADRVEVATRVAGVTQRDPDGEKETIEEGLEPVDQQQKHQQPYEASLSGSEGRMGPGTKAGASMLDPVLEKVSDTPNIPISKSWNPNDGEKRPDPASSAPSSSASAAPGASTMEFRRNAPAPTKIPPHKLSQKGKKTIWKPAVDPVSGRTYYYHRLTRKTTWSKPVDLDTVVEEEEDPTERTAEPTEFSERDGEGNGQLTESKTNAQRTGAFTVDDVIRKTKARDFDQGIWQQKQEITKLLKTMAPPDGKSIENLMMEYEGRESELLMQLRDLKESRPFDEPLATDSVTSDEHATRSFQKAVSLNPQTSTGAFSAASELKSRVRTATSARSGRSGRTTRSGGTKISEKTELIKNTAGGRKMVAAARIDELGSASECTSLSSEGMELRGAVKKTINSTLSGEGMELRAMTSGEMKEPTSTKRTAPRTRELLVEELSYDRPKAETYDMRGVVRRSQRMGRSRPPLAPESKSENHQNQHHHNNNRSRPFTTPYTHDADESTSRGSETLSRTTDSISALSMTDLDVSHSKQPVGADSARRRALDEAIAREDWDLAAALSEGMRTIKSKQVRSRQSGGEWTQSALDKFISQNDWDAVANYIAHIRARAKDDDNNPPPPRTSSRGVSAGGITPSSSRVSSGKRLGAVSPSSRPESSFDTDDSSNLRKRFGARSQLQHDDMQSESTSYDSEESSSSASEESSSESSYSEPSSDVIGKRRYGGASGNKNVSSSRMNSSSRRQPPVRAPRTNSRPKEFAC